MPLPYHPPPPPPNCPRRKRLFGREVQLFFTDKTGVRWEIFDYIYLAGRRVLRRPGEGNADWRVFVPPMGEPREVRLRGGETQRPYPRLLEQQLAEARNLAPKA